MWQRSHMLQSARGIRPKKAAAGLSQRRPHALLPLVDSPAGSLTRRRGTRYTPIHGTFRYHSALDIAIRLNRHHGGSMDPAPVSFHDDPVVVRQTYETDVNTQIYRHSCS